MRRSSLGLFVLLLLLACVVPQVHAQSGSRGSSSRGGGGRMAPRGASGVPSRVGGSRSKTIQSGARPTGMMNSANAARMSGGARSGGSGSRPSTGLSSRGSFSPSYGGGGVSRGGGARPATTGLSRPSRSRSRSRPTGTANVVGSVPNASTNGYGSLPAGYRVWTDASGRYSISGQLAAQRDGTVWIRRTDGKYSKLSLRQLSQKDQQFLNGSSG